MATNELQARITADISGLESGLKKAQKLQSDYAKSISKTQNEIAQNIQISKGYERAIEQLNNELKDGTISQKQYQKQLQRLQRDEKETAIDTANLRKELNRLKRDQKDLAVTSTKTSKGMTSFGKQTANATPSVIEFSRVIQDAPYGIQGVANNIQQLTTNFGYLRTQAGGTIPALKAFAGSFLGPAGIVFAVSTITSLLVTYGDELLSSVGSTNKLAKATAEFLGDAQAEIVTLRTLVGIAQDKSQSDQVRAQAVEELNDKYGDYLGNLTLEEIQTDAVNDSVQRLTRSLIKQAQVRGLEARIQEITSDGAEDLIDNQLKLSEAYKTLQYETKNALNSSSALASRIDGGLGARELAREIIEVSKALNLPVPQGVVSARGEVNRLNKEVKSLKKETEEATKPLEELLKGGLADRLLLDSQAEITVDGVELTPQAQAERDAGLSTRAKITGIDQSEIQSGSITPIEVPITANAEGIEEALLSVNRFKDNLQGTLETARIFSDGVAGAIQGMTSTISSSIETGNAAVDGFFGSLIKSLSGYLAEMAAMAIQDIAIKKAQSTAGAVTAATSSAAATGPAAAFVLPALIAGAIAVVAGAFGGIKFASGGIVPGGSFQGDRVPALLNSGEMILNAGQQANLFGMLNGNLASLQGQSAGSDIVGEIVLRGQNQLVQLKRTEKKFKRYYNS